MKEDKLYQIMASYMPPAQILDYLAPSFHILFSLSTSWKELIKNLTQHFTIRINHRLTIKQLKQIMLRASVLRSLHLRGSGEYVYWEKTTYSNLSFLVEFTELKKIYIENLPIESFSDLSALSLLGVLHIKGWYNNLASLPFSGLSNLNTLYLRWSPARTKDISSITELKKLKYLSVTNCAKINALNLSGLMHLTRFNLENCRDLSQICLPDLEHNKLKEVCIKNVTKLQDFSFLSKVGGIEKLSLDVKLKGNKVGNFLSKLTNLKKLNLATGSQQGKELSFISEFKNLEEIRIANCPNELGNFLFFPHPKKIKKLTLEGSNARIDHDYSISDLSFISKLENLEELKLVRFKYIGIEDFSLPKKIKDLFLIDLFNVEVLNLSDLKDLKRFCLKMEHIDHITLPDSEQLECLKFPWEPQSIVFFRTYRQLLHPNETDIDLNLRGSKIQDNFDAQKLGNRIVKEIMDDIRNRLKNYDVYDYRGLRRFINNRSDSLENLVFSLQDLFRVYNRNLGIQAYLNHHFKKPPILRDIENIFEELKIRHLLPSYSVFQKPSSSKIRFFCSISSSNDIPSPVQDIIFNKMRAKLELENENRDEIMTLESEDSSRSKDSSLLKSMPD